VFHVFFYYATAIADYVPTEGNIEVSFERSALVPEIFYKRHDPGVVEAEKIPRLIFVQMTAVPDVAIGEYGHIMFDPFLIKVLALILHNPRGKVVGGHSLLLNVLCEGR
jgi:hypothetical protein